MKISQPVSQKITGKPDAEPGREEPGKEKMPSLSLFRLLVGKEMHKELGVLRRQIKFEGRLFYQFQQRDVGSAEALIRYPFDRSSELLTFWENSHCVFLRLMD
jgi:hypothetical protein